MRSDHVILLLKTLRWLTIAFTMKPRLLRMACQASHDLAHPFLFIPSPMTLPGSPTSLQGPTAPGPLTLLLLLFEIISHTSLQRHMLTHSFSPRLKQGHILLRGLDADYVGVSLRDNSWS